MPTGKREDPSELLYKGESVLGKPTTVQTPGTVEAPLSAGLAAAPVMGGPGPSEAVTGGVGLGDGGPAGPSTLQTVQQALGAGGKTADFINRLIADSEAGGAPSGMEKPGLPGEPSGFLGSTRVSDIVPGLAPSPNAFLGPGTTFGVAQPGTGLGVLNYNALAPGTTFSLPSGPGASLPPATFSGAEKPALALGAAEPAAANAAGGAGGGAGAGAAGAAGTVGAGAGALAAILGLIASQTGNRELGYAAQGAGAASAGAGAASGALAGTATPGLVMAPMALGVLALSIADSINAPKVAAELRARVNSLLGRLPTEVQNVQRGAQMGLQVDPNAISPEALKETQQIAQELQNIIGGFKGSGTYNFLEKGRTTVGGDLFFADKPDYKFPQGPQLLQNLSPYLQALQFGQLRAADVLGRAGQPIPGYGMEPTKSGASWFDPVTLTSLVGGPQLQQALYPTYEGGRPEGFELPEGSYWVGGTPSNQSGAFGAGEMMGLPGTQAIVQASNRQPGWEQHTVTRTPYGWMRTDLLRELQALKPGGLEQGLVGLAERFGGVNPAYRLLSESRTVPPEAEPAPAAAPGGAQLGEQIDELIKKAAREQ